MNELERIKREDWYRQAWEAQNKKDIAANPRLSLRNNAIRNGNDNKANGHLGGRPKKEANKLPLTKEAEMVNRMLQRGMTLKAAAEIIGMSPRWASDIKRKYDLPR